jgi:hypothetical protein
MIIAAKLTSGKARLTFAVDKTGILRYESAHKLNHAVFFRVLPHFAAFLPSPTRLSPVSECYSSCQTHMEAGTMSSRTTNQRYYLIHDRGQRDTLLGAAGSNLPECAGDCTDLSARAGARGQRFEVLTSILRRRTLRPGTNARGHLAPARPGDQQPSKGDRAHLAYSPDPAAAPQIPEARRKIERKAHPSHLFPSPFLHRSHIHMLQCFSNMEAPTQKEIRWTGLRSGLKIFFKGRFRFVSTLAGTQNATVASSNESASAARRDHSPLVHVSAHEKGGIAA